MPVDILANIAKNSYFFSNVYSRIVDAQYNIYWQFEKNGVTSVKYLWKPSTSTIFEDTFYNICWNPMKVCGNSVHIVYIFMGNLYNSEQYL